jgi:hypothetical protein
MVTMTVPGDSSVPMARNHSAPLAMMCAAAASVSTLLTTVGFAVALADSVVPSSSRPPDGVDENSPCRYGGRMRGSGSRPSITSSKPFSSP